MSAELCRPSQVTRRVEALTWLTSMEPVTLSTRVSRATSSSWLSRRQPLCARRYVRCLTLLSRPSVSEAFAGVLLDSIEVERDTKARAAGHGQHAIRVELPWRFY